MKIITTVSSLLTIALTPLLLLTIILIVSQENSISRINKIISTPHQIVNTDSIYKEGRNDGWDDGRRYESCRYINTIFYCGTDTFFMNRGSDKEGHEWAELIKQ